MFGFVYTCTIRKHFGQFSSNFRLNPNMTMNTVYGVFVDFALAGVHHSVVDLTVLVEAYKK